MSVRITDIEFQVGGDGVSQATKITHNLNLSDVDLMNGFPMVVMSNNGILDKFVKQRAKDFIVIAHSPFTGSMFVKVSRP